MLAFKCRPVNASLTFISQTEVKLHQIGPLILKLLDSVYVVRMASAKIKVTAEVCG